MKRIYQICLIVLLSFSSIVSWGQGTTVQWDSTYAPFAKYGFGIGTVPNGITLSATQVRSDVLPVPLIRMYEYDTAIVTIRGGSQVLSPSDLVSSSTMSGDILDATFVINQFQNIGDAEYYVANYANISATSELFVMENDSTPANSFIATSVVMDKYGSYRVPVIPGGFLVFGIGDYSVGGGYQQINLAGIWVSVQFCRHGG